MLNATVNSSTSVDTQVSSALAVYHVDEKGRSVSNESITPTEIFFETLKPVLGVVLLLRDLCRPASRHGKSNENRHRLVNSVTETAVLRHHTFIG